MEVVKIVNEDVVILKMDGKLDAVSSVEVEKAFNEVISDGHKKIVINMSGVSYISSAGLRVLLVAAKNIREIDGKIIISSMINSVKKVFEISGFSTIFTIVENDEEAINRF